MRKNLVILDCYYWIGAFYRILRLDTLQMYKKNFLESFTSFACFCLGNIDILLVFCSRIFTEATITKKSCSDRKWTYNKENNLWCHLHQTNLNKRSWIKCWLIHWMDWSCKNRSRDIHYEENLTNWKMFLFPSYKSL